MVGFIVELSWTSNHRSWFLDPHLNVAELNIYWDKFLKFGARKRLIHLEDTSIILKIHSLSIVHA